MKRTLFCTHRITMMHFWNRIFLYVIRCLLSVWFICCKNRQLNANGRKFETVGVQNIACARSGAFFVQISRSNFVCMWLCEPSILSECHRNIMAQNGKMMMDRLNRKRPEFGRITFSKSKYGRSNGKSHNVWNAWMVWLYSTWMRP